VHWAISLKLKTQRPGASFGLKGRPDNHSKCVHHGTWKCCVPYLWHVRIDTHVCPERLSWFVTLPDNTENLGNLIRQTRTSPYMKRQKGGRRRIYKKNKQRVNTYIYFRQYLISFPKWKHEFLGISYYANFSPEREASSASMIILLRIFTQYSLQFSNTKLPGSRHRHVQHNKGKRKLQVHALRNLTLVYAQMFCYNGASRP